MPRHKSPSKLFQAPALTAWALLKPGDLEGRPVRAALRESIWIPVVWKALVKSRGPAPAVLCLLLPSLAAWKATVEESGRGKISPPAITPQDPFCALVPSSLLLSRDGHSQALPTCLGPTTSLFLVTVPSSPSKLSPILASQLLWGEGPGTFLLRNNHPFLSGESDPRGRGALCN